MEIFKRTVLGILIFLILVGCVFLYGAYNLKAYSIYYANHIPHKKGSEPVLVMMGEINSFTAPELDNVKYNFDGRLIISIYNEETNKYSHYYSADMVEFYPSFQSFNNTYYAFKKGFELQAVYVNENKVSVSNFDRSEVIKEVYHTFAPVIDTLNVKPDVNLQWLFNWWYWDRFN